MPTVEEAIEYLGIDYPDKLITSNVERCLRAAVRTLHGAVGADVESFLPGDPRVQELVLIYTEDLYNNRGVSAKVSGSTRNLVASMELQLQMELRTARAQEVESV